MPRIEDLSPLQKVAVFLIALGQETAKEVLRQMDDEETRLIAGAIVEMHSVTPELQEEVLEEEHLLDHLETTVRKLGVPFIKVK